MNRYVNLLLLIGFSVPCSALNILLVNDDGLSPNLQAQYEALVHAGHHVLVSFPCTNQSGKGASLTIGPIAPLTLPCRGGAAAVGAAGVGNVAGKPDFYYVGGTPVMATMYGLDVLAGQRWGREPDLVLSGPNEGQNTGPLLNSSGTVSNAQYAASVGLSAIAVSADADTANDPKLAAEAAQLILRLVDSLQKHADHGRLLPQGLALNVNYPKFAAGHGAELHWVLTRQGSYGMGQLRFAADLSKEPAAAAAGTPSAYPGIVYSPATAAPTEQQRNDEGAVIRTGKVTVTIMQAGFDADSAKRQSLSRALDTLFR